VAFSVWTAGKILTLDNLEKRHVIVMDWCCMCKKIGKLMAISYSIVKWLEIYGNQFSVLVMPPWVELLASWRGQFGGHRNIEVWRTVSLCLMW
jgi:hypothetical protein